MTTLETKQVAFKYGSSEAYTLSDINFSIKQGEFISIVGPSGSGKSTLLRLLAGHISPTEGQILFNNEQMEGPEQRLVPGYEEIQLVHQQYELRPNISARENIAAKLKGYTREYREERVEFLLKFFMLHEIQDHQPRALSGGQQQRLAIAMAMANEPEVLLMDEPFSALDPMKSALFIQEIKRLSREMSTAVVLVTHDSRDAMLSDQVIFLNHGKILQADAPEKIYYNPADEETASFFGPINVLSPEELELFGITSQKEAAIRAESFQINTNDDGLELKISETIFRGAYQMLVLEMPTGKNLSLFDFKKEFKKGDLLNISTEESQLIHF